MGNFQLDPVQNGFFNPPGLQNKRVAAIVGDVVQAAQESTMARPGRVFQGPSIEIQVGYIFNTQNDDTDFWIANHFTATYLGLPASIEDCFLAAYMLWSWASFVATGDPNNADVTTKICWPKYSGGQQNMVWQMQGSTTEKDDYRKEGIQFIIDNIFF
ncbi:hypothetical protein B0H10DRAFT_2212950 [Mycena sp. CBHHK59/15]|nr:hypothetical protein B0H10DRAFT_2212950 [Mycena sp. CBHHK59/15]